MKRRILNFNGTLFPVVTPKVMGIVNVTPDSFYPESRADSAKDIVARCEKMLEEGADILDVGAVSTRPGCDDVSQIEECRRLDIALKSIRHSLSSVAISLDTFRADVAERMIGEYGVSIINDVSGGCDAMFEVAARTRTPYVLTHNPLFYKDRCINQTVAEDRVLSDEDSIMSAMSLFFSERCSRLNSLGASDIILDPGFGFGKNTSQNYIILKSLRRLSVHELPIMVGLSRKTMIREVLGTDVSDSLNGTTALNMASLMSGVVNFLRVHDVKEASQVVKLYNHLR